MLIRPYPDQEGNKLGSVSGGARGFNNIETRAVIKSFFLQIKAPKEIHDILTETLACDLPVRAKDLSAPRYKIILFFFSCFFPVISLLAEMA